MVVLILNGHTCRQFRNQIQQLSRQQKLSPGYGNQQRAAAILALQSIQRQLLHPVTFAEQAANNLKPDRALCFS